MQKILLSSLLIGFLVFCFAQDRTRIDRAAQLKAYKNSLLIYQQAETQLEKAGDNEILLAKADELYQQSLESFTTLLPAIETGGYDSLVFHLKRKTGFIHYYFDQGAEAKKDYLAVIALQKKLPVLPDSLVFIPCLFTGGIYYEQGQFDSALSFYKKAEQISDAYPAPLEEEERLYNRLGAMFYETGNYKQAKNYFEKAISLAGPGNRELVANYRINIASLLVKTEEYAEAKRIFESILPATVFENEINHNLGIISIKEKNARKAIGYLRKVQYTDNRKNIDLLYNFALAYAGLGKKDSSAAYVEKALVENSKWYGQRKSIPHGLILKFEGDQLQEVHSFQTALVKYQQAIGQFHPKYSDTSIYHNPDSFTGVYSFINLFNTLVAKAVTMEKWWQEDKDTRKLEASLQTYQAAFQLAAHVERTYNSDEARLFLGKLKYTVHNEPIDISLRLYELTQQQEYLASAYLFDQQNKASALSLTIQENDLRNNGEGSGDLLKKEAGLKTDITRLSLRAVTITNTAAAGSIDSAIREKEIELDRLQQQLNEEPGWAAKRSLEQIPPVSQLQKAFDKNTVLLSFHLSAVECVAFFITPSELSYQRIPIDSSFFTAISSFKNALYNTRAEQRFDGATAAGFLYSRLIAPFQNKLGKAKRMIIIPDDELNGLPFEALQDRSKRYLVESFAVQYQYSTALFNKHSTQPSRYAGKLSFAPFASSGSVNDTATLFSPLPASGEEVAGLAGKVFLDTAATKENFLRTVNQYSIVHLATHASVDNTDPSRSFIAFYPGSADHKLYGPEIANLRLDSTRLVILSACETGAGQLVRGEGLMSLSRAFAYAGCPGIITSLWKAEDQTTAYLTQRLHHYLDKDYTTDKALQLAQLDLLQDKEMDPRFRSPNYWAHLVFIGDYEKENNSKNKSRLFILAAVIIVVTGFFLTKSLLAKSKQARFP